MEPELLFVTVRRPDGKTREITPHMNTREQLQSLYANYGEPGETVTITGIGERIALDTATP
jgi:hypothetical protein